MSLLNDRQLKKLYKHTKFIEPFFDHKVSEGVVSFGLSHSGYDIRISNKFMIPMEAKEDAVVDVKKPDSNTVFMEVNTDVFTLAPNSYVLGLSVERFNIPDNIMGVAVGKSTYARTGIFCNITPLEPNWEGYLVIEIANLGKLPVKIYANEGIAQIMFYKIQKVETGYSGKYQDQKYIVVPSIGVKDVR